MYVLFPASRWCVKKMLHLFIVCVVRLVIWNSPDDVIIFIFTASLRRTTVYTHTTYNTVLRPMHYINVWIFCSDRRRMKMEKGIRRYDAKSPLTPCNLCCGQVSATHHLARVSLSLPTPSSTAACLAPWALVTPGQAMPGPASTTTRARALVWPGSSATGRILGLALSPPLPPHSLGLYQKCWSFFKTCATSTVTEYIHETGKDVFSCSRTRFLPTHFAVCFDILV